MGQEGKAAHLCRGEVHVVDFDPGVGAETRKTRPALILQNDVGNRFGSTTIVAAITSRGEPPFYPVEVRVPAGEGGLLADSTVRLDHLRTIDRKRLRRFLGALEPSTMARVDRALRASLGLA